MSDNEMDRDTELQRLESIVEKLLNKYSELKAERDGLVQTVKERENTIAERDTTISEREATLAERDATIVERDATIVARDETIRNLESQVEDKSNERSRISEKVNSIMGQIELWEMSLDEENSGEEHGDHGEHGQQDMF